MYIFFTTDHRGDSPFGYIIGSSVLARSGDRSLIFGAPLYDLTRHKFINVSLELVENKDFPGLPAPMARSS
jgi:hypothetical protein